MFFKETKKPTASTIRILSDISEKIRLVDVALCQKELEAMPETLLTKREIRKLRRMRLEIFQMYYEVRHRFMPAESAKLGVLKNPKD